MSDDKIIVQSCGIVAPSIEQIQRQAFEENLRKEYEQKFYQKCLAFDERAELYRLTAEYAGQIQCVSLSTPSLADFCSPEDTVDGAYALAQAVVAKRKEIMEGKV